MRSLLLLLIALCGAAALAACNGCGESDATELPMPDKPTVRLFLLSSLAGALEPCGCSDDQLGGLDHLAAYVESQKDAPGLLLATGPLLFLEPTLAADHARQDEMKADAIAQTMKQLGLAAWAPGYNDWAAGADALAKRRDQAGATLVAANVSNELVSTSKIIEAGGVKIGVVGVSVPKTPSGDLPKGVTLDDDSKIAAVIQAELAKLKDQGARLTVAVAAMDRGAALRIADRVPSLDILAIGSGFSQGHGNTEQPAATMIGGTLVVETANHGQSLAVIDLYLRGDGRLADGGGVAKAEQIADLSQQIRKLEHRINSWEKGGKVDPSDLAARKADLARLRKEREALEAKKKPPAAGSFFEYRVVEVREALGESKTIAEQMRDYYKQVNEHNKTAFADRTPQKLEAGKAGYVGVDACSDCHSEEREVWDKTKHAHAYETLVKDLKEYNLDCVGCHVTGYSKPGGSTVTHNEPLRGVQCETCHGPGSLHMAAPEDPALIIVKPDPRTCVDDCHHPPHVDGFDPVSKMDLVLGPGHERQ